MTKRDKKLHTHSNDKSKCQPDFKNQVDDIDNQLKKEMALLLIELKAFAAQSSPAQKIKSRKQNKMRLKEVDFLIGKKKAS